MKIEANVWQKVPGTNFIEIFPIITKPSIVSSNCYILAAPEAILIIDPGASPEQTKHISETVNAALAASHRPVLVFLTHCHQDHSQEAGGFELPAGTEIKRFAHEAGVEALKRGDRNLTVAYLYPWSPEICPARFRRKTICLKTRSLKSTHSNWPTADGSSCTASRSRCPMAPCFNANGSPLGAG